MKKIKAALCILGFAAVCLAALLLFSVYLSPGSYILGAPEGSWELADPSGAVRPIDDSYAIPEGGELPEGACYRMTARMPTAEEMPGLYDEGYISFTPRGAEQALYIGGALVFSSHSPSDAEVRLSVDPAWAGCELTLEYRPASADFRLSSPFFSNTCTDFRFVAAMSDLYAIPTGVFLTLSVLVTALLFAGLAFGMPDWNLIVLALAAFSTAAWNLNAGLGYYFLPFQWYSILGNRWLALIPIGAMVLYLSLNRKRSFWRRFGLTALISLAAAAAWYFYLRLTGDPFAMNIEIFLQSPLDSQGILSLVIEYLVAVCFGISMFDLVRRQLAAASEAQALSVWQDMLLDSYRNMERSVQETAVMRHEWKNRVSSLHLLARQGDIEGLTQSLDQLDTQLDRLFPATFSSNFTVNVILQNAAARARDAGVSFTASAPLPEELGVDSADLCSLLINMLNNAVKAASAAPEGDRRVAVSLKITQSFLAIKCENTYAGSLPLDSEGELKKEDPMPAGHGYGLAQMRHTAEKYGGILDVSWTSSVFTAQTALTLK